MLGECTAGLRTWISHARLSSDPHGIVHNRFVPTSLFDLDFGTPSTIVLTVARYCRYIHDESLLRSELRARHEYTVVRIDGCYGRFNFPDEVDGSTNETDGSRSSMLGRSTRTTGCQSYAYFDKRSASRMSAIMNAFKTALVLLVLGELSRSQPFANHLAWEQDSARRPSTPSHRIW
jgi:hypothetical protein